MNIPRMIRMLLAAALAFAVAVPVATAATRNQIIRDCADGSLDGKYSASEMRDARNNLPADVDEYTDCRDLLTQSTRPGGTGTTGGPVVSGAGDAPNLSPSSPEEEQKLREARLTAGSAAVDVDGEKIVPGAAGFASDFARRGLPAPLVALLILLALAAVAGAVPSIRRRVLRRHQA